MQGEGKPPFYNVKNGGGLMDNETMMALIPLLGTMIGTGVEDISYICQKDATDTYVWVAI